MGERFEHISRKFHAMARTKFEDLLEEELLSTAECLLLFIFFTSSRGLVRSVGSEFREVIGGKMDGVAFMHRPVFGERDIVSMVSVS